MKENRVSLTIYDILLVFTALVGLSNVFFLTLGIFHTFISILTAGIIGGFLLFIFKPTIEKPKFSLDKTFLAIVLLALVLRVPPWLYVLGGQDQGTYVNISKQYEEGRHLYAIDNFRETLTENQKETYDRLANYMMPSFEKWNREDSEYTMKFYPMHPSFLANFGQMLGSDNRVYSLTFFSLISLVNIYFIVKMLSGSKKAGMFAMFLLAINPLHAFFSKMPVGEITALAFSTGGFYFLLKFFEAYKKEVSNKRELFLDKPFFLYLSALMFFAFMFVRMTFFIYLILFFLVLLGIILLSKDKILKLYFTAYFGTLFILSVVSYTFYKIALWPLYNMIFNSTVAGGVKRLINFYGDTFEEKLIFVIIIAFLTLVLTFFVSKAKIVNKANFEKTCLFAILAGILFLFYQAFNTSVSRYYRLAYTGYESYERYNISQKGTDTLKNIPMLAIGNHASFVSILLLLIYFFYAVKQEKINYKLFSAFFSASFFFVLYSMNISYMRYDYYNSRYYLSEAVPALLIFSSVFIFELFSKCTKCSNYVIGFFAGIMILGFLPFTLIQLKGPEMEDNSFYTDLLEENKGKDTLYVYISHPEPTKYETNFNLYAFAPFKYYYGQKTLVLRHEIELYKKDVKDLLNRFENVVYLSNKKIKLPNMEERTLTYTHYNNAPGCGYHNYEFLDLANVHTLPIPDNLKCITLPGGWFVREKGFYVYISYNYLE